LNKTPRLDDRRDRLITAAARLFRQQGYERTSVRQLAEAVGILSGSVFHHFDSKEDILMAVMSTTIATMIERLSDASKKAPAPSRRLRELVRTELDLLHGDTRDGVAVAFFQWHSLAPDAQEKVLGLRAEYEAIWLEALGSARDSGLIEGDPFILRRLLAGANGWTIYWYRPDGDLTIDGLANQILRLLIRNPADS
jgi:AcrR family transcriptional regulator